MLIASKFLKICGGERDGVRSETEAWEPWLFCGDSTEIDCEAIIVDSRNPLGIPTEGFPRLETGHSQ